MAVTTPGGIGKARTGNHPGWQIVFASESPPAFGELGPQGALEELTGSPVAGALAGGAIAGVAEIARSIGEMVGLTHSETLTLSSTDYAADIEAALNDGLSGGRFSIMVEGLGDKEHAWLRQKMRDKSRLTAKLYLFWQDIGDAWLANLAGAFDALQSSTAEPEGLVAKIVVTSVRRRLGQKRYETEITGLESVFFALRSSRILSNPSDKIATVIKKIEAASGIEIAAILPKDSEQEKKEKAKEDATAPASQRCSEILRGIIERLEQPVSGPSQFLIRDGSAVLGQRKVPYRVGDAAKDGTAPIVLDAATGLIEITSEVTDKGELPEEDLPKDKLDQFALILSGRYDLKPGELVRFAAPDPEEPVGISIGAAMIGAFGAPLLGEVFEPPNTVMYVASVLHRLGRTTGFQTTIKGVVYKDAKFWTAKPPGSKAQGSKGAKSDSADPAIAAALKWKELVQGSVDQLSLLEVGQVLRHTVAPDPANGVVGLSSTVSEGLVPGDGRAQGAFSLDLVEPGKMGRSVPNIAYATPFAWGHCGLVLPRYPGANVLLGYRKGKAYDTIDLGTIWRRGLMPKAEPGDWWLTLPVDAQEKSGSDAAAPADRHRGKVSNDLIDAAGDRIIETSSFVVRAGKSSLSDAGADAQRPAMGDAYSEGITIEHKGSKARISIDSQGNIELSGRTITLSADDVKVKVKNKMNVE